jgi:trimeric autotransporter adhesin
MMYIRNNNAEKTKEWGLIAQELQQTLKDAGYQDVGVVSEDKPPEKYMTVRYNDLLAPMIKGMQEQQKLIAAQQKAIDALQKEVALLKNKK